MLPSASHQAPDDVPAPATASCLLQSADVTAPLPFYDIFRPDRPVELDLGCGKGRFLLARARANPEVQYLGVDRMLPRIRKLDRKVQRLGLGNVRLLRLEAAYTLQYLLPEHSIRRVYLFFPDPWPKRRHHKRRLFDAVFRELLWTRLVPGGEIQIATDHLDYFAEMQRQLRADARFEEVAPMSRSDEEQTDFELIFRGQGLPIGACGFRTRADAGER
ncbi:MAG: tRNA (guanosine(46)-N7)-methyltransferase TrmB [Kiritimatiellae bacterium]|nr:tRNA (guanosine(46)-N7)-methyltransferase TrmB [Kiritimatiellia bacterium]